LKDTDGNDKQWDNKHEAQSVARAIEGCFILLLGGMKLSVNLGKGELFKLVIDEGPIHPSISLFVGLALTLFQLYAIEKEVCFGSLHPLLAAYTLSSLHVHPQP
jgi:hypothetical protein